MLRYAAPRLVRRRGWSDGSGRITRSIRSAATGKWVETRGKHMRIVRFLLSYVMLSVFGLLLSLFLAQNSHTEQLSYFGVSLSTNFAWVVLAAAAAGFLGALLLILPGRFAATLHNWTLGREAGQLEQQVALLNEQRERLLAKHERLLEGHEHMLLRYERLLAAHSRVVAERDEAWAQLGTSGTAQLPAERDTLPPNTLPPPDSAAPLQLVDVVPSTAPSPSPSASPSAPPSETIIREVQSALPDTSSSGLIG